MKQIYLEGKTLHEKQIRYYNGAYCSYCDKPTDFVDSIKVYQESHGYIYYCKDCQAWVNCINVDQALGSLADKNLRNLRRQVQQLLQPMIDRKVSYGYDRKKVHVKVREWISKILSCAIEEAHVAMMTDEQCHRMIAEIKAHEKTPEQIKALEQDILIRKVMITFLCDSMDIKVTEVHIPFTQYSFEKNGKKYHYNFRDHAGYWDGKAVKYKKLDVTIDEFLNNHFGHDKS